MATSRIQPAVAGLLALAGALYAVSPLCAEAEERDAVLLLHGLARQSNSMVRLADRLAGAGYQVHNIDYPSTSGTPAQLVEIVRSAFDSCCTEVRRVHFVTHSLGAILTRLFIDESRPPNLGRVVMIAPPNQGSEIVDLLGDWPLFHSWFGPTAASLRTDDSGLTHRLPDPDYEVGVIAGDWPINPLGAVLIPGRDDGGVSVEGARVPGMADFLTVHRSHGRITLAPEVAAQALYFLKNGLFDRRLVESLRNSP